MNDVRPTASVMNRFLASIQQLRRSRSLVPVAVAAGLAILVAAGGGASLSVGAQQASTPAADACPAATPASGTPAAGECVTIDLKDIFFSPNVITLPSNTPVELVLKNGGAATHNFSVTDHGNPGLENLDIDVTLDPGQTQTVTIDAPAGNYYFFCNQPGHEAAGMRGYLEIADGAAIATAEATVTPAAGS